MLSGKKRRRWDQISIHGSWIKGVSAGGCRQYPETFWTNPQYRVSLQSCDEKENTGEVDIKISIVVYYLLT